MAHTELTNIVAHPFTLFLLFSFALFSLLCGWWISKLPGTTGTYLYFDNKTESAQMLLSPWDLTSASEVERLTLAPCSTHKHIVLSYEWCYSIVCFLFYYLQFIAHFARVHLSCAL